MESESCDHDGEQSGLNGAVIEHLVLSRPAQVCLGRVLILELATNGAVANGDGRSFGKHFEGLTNDIGANEGHDAIC